MSVRVLVAMLRRFELYLSVFVVPCGDRFSTAKSRLNRLALEPWGVAAAVSLRSHGYYLHALWRYTALHSITSGIRALHSINADKRAL